MYYVPDGTEMCGFYECEECANRFYSLKIGPKLVCPYCGEEPDMEIGPDEEMPVAKETAKLLEVVEGAEKCGAYGCVTFISSNWRRLRVDLK